MEESWDDIIAEAGDGFNRPPAGEYDFVIDEAEAKVSKAGNQMIRVKARITGGPEHGKGIKDFFVIRSKTQAEKFMLHMRAVGVTLDTLRDHKPTMAQLAKALEGKPFRGKVKHTSDDDYGDQAELAWTMKPPTGGAVAVTEFAAVTEAEALGYGSGEAPVAADDAAF